ncbi:MAG: DUF87 domain-containing protein [Gammaproteobacteria bacterium]|nr:DUF87 domain-containing protein [Gammaproteobacteria bacterium]
MQDFEKLGAFYLGKKFDVASDEMTDELVLYDARDLTTHAVIIGMTGSGKTGLGVGIIEEAAMDNVPVIAIDPKGDMGNLLLTFPSLSAAKFKPWIDPQAAQASGQDASEFAAGQAALWKKGLKGWGQDGARIKRLRDTAEFAIYTPGSSAGRQISVLENFTPPPAAVLNDKDIYNDQVQATATSILSLIGIDADPITSREHILIANVLDHYWREGKSLDIGALIAAIQQPPMAKIGVMEMDAFFAAKDRFALAMRLNNLLAAPGFDAWMTGEPLDTARLLHTADGKPKVSVVSIAHLSDAERMFFVSMLLADIVSWMRSQPGTGSLRALLYMDEIFGYMPPSANPPTKKLLLTMLKQARAYGLGLVLSTQNPVDLDYKGLSNTGTWFIGRLQTERDKMRVMEGLEGAAAGGKFDKQKMEQILAGLGKRRFLLHNVHEDEDVVFGTRWVMSYLAGPMTRDQIKRLNADNPPTVTATEKSRGSKARATETVTSFVDSTPPALDPKISQYFLPCAQTCEGDLVYEPMFIGAAEVVYSSARYKVETEKHFLMLGEFDEPPLPVQWEEAEPLDMALDDLLTASESGQAEYGELGAAATKARNYLAWEKLFKRWLRNDNPITLYRSKELKATSEAGESVGDFRVRLQVMANEARDLAVDKLRSKYASKVAALEERLRKAKQTLEREKEQAKSKKLDTAMSFGTAILGALLGRKKVSYTSASRVRTAMGRLGSSRKEAGDVARAEETLETLTQKLLEMNAKLEEEVAALGDSFNMQNAELSEIVIKAKSTEILIHFVGLAWVPFAADSKGRLRSLIE